MVPDQILEQIGQSWELPVEAMEQAAAQKDAVGPKLVGLLERAADPSATLTAPDHQRVLLGTALLAEWRERRAYDPIVRLLTVDDERVFACFGDGVTELLGQVLVALGEDRDISPLTRVVSDEQTDEFIRIAALDAWCYLSWARGTDRDTLRRGLEDLLGSFEPELDLFLGARWAELVVVLGLDEALEDRIGEVMQAQGDETFAIMTSEDLDDTRAKRDEFGTPAAFADLSIWPFEDAIGTFSTWYGFTPEGVAERREEADWEDDGDPFAEDPFEEGLGESIRDRVERLEARHRANRPPGDAPRDPGLFEPMSPAPEPVHNPYRDVGRNAPCPCGSGKKFKKCCGG